MNVGVMLEAAAVALVALVGACAGAAPSQSPSAPTETSGLLSPSPGQAHAEIDRLFTTIDADMRDAGMTMQEPGSAPEPMADVPEIQATCDGAAVADRGDGTCHDVCTLSTSICSNASRICDLTEQLPGDDWAAGRCNAGTDACATAHARCCGCR